MKILIVIFLIFIFIKVSFCQDTNDYLPKMEIHAHYMLKYHKDTIYFGVIRNDSAIEVERIFIRIENSIYLSFLNDSTFEIGKFRRYNVINLCNRKFIEMEKKRYWRLFENESQICRIVDNHLHYQYRYIKIFPFLTLVLKK